MIYTIAKLREYTRQLDKRLSVVTTYPDSYIDSRIEEGLAIAQDIKPIFYTKEKYDLTDNITVDLLNEVEIILQREVHSIPSIECDLTFFKIYTTPNNHIVLTRETGAQVPVDLTVTVRYFFYPTLPITSIEMSMEMYKLAKEGIAINCFARLSDEVNEAKHQAKADALILRGTFDIDSELMAISVDRLWRSSWV